MRYDATNGEFLAAALERLIDAIENYRQNTICDDYRENRTLDDEIERAKRDLKDADNHY